MSIKDQSKTHDAILNNLSRWEVGEVRLRKSMSYYDEIKADPALQEKLQIDMVRLDSMVEEKQAEERRRLLKIHQQILPAKIKKLRRLPQTMRMNSLLLEADFWRDDAESLAQLDLTWKDVMDWEDEQLRIDAARREKAKAAKARKFDKARSLIETGEMAAIGMQFDIQEDEFKPVKMVFELSEEVRKRYPPLVLAHILHAISCRLSGFSHWDEGKPKKGYEWVTTEKGSYRKPIPEPEHCLYRQAGLPAFFELFERRKELAHAITRIEDLDPEFLHDVGRADAIAISGMTKAAFDDAVNREIIPIAWTGEFQKWGKTLEARRFNIADVLNLVEQDHIKRFLQSRIARSAVRRKNGAAKSIETRERRETMREMFRNVLRADASQYARESGDFLLGLRCELFTWAKWASCIAVSSPSKMKQAYVLTTSAMLCLFEAGACDLVRIYAPMKRIRAKCAIHAEGGYHSADSIGCPDCEWTSGSHTSLCLFYLNGAPELNPVILPYPFALKAKFPGISNIPRRDFGPIYNYSVSDDERALFTLAEIEQEIRRLINVLISGRKDIDPPEA